MSPLKTALSIAAATALLVLGLRAAGVLEVWELRARDQAMRWRTGPEAPPERVAIVRIDEADLQRLGHPLPDAVLADLVETLLESGARAVGVDVYRDRAVPPGETRLRDVVLSDDRVVMIEKLPDARGPGVAPPAFLREHPERLGFADLLIDRDGIVRRGLLFLWDDEGGAHLSLALRLVLRHLRDEGVGLRESSADPEWVRLGGVDLPPFERGDGGYHRADDGGYQWLLDYGRGGRAFPTVRASDVLDGAVAPELLRDRVVLVGTTAPSVRDDFFTPLSAGARTTRPGFGVEVHARAVDQLLRIGLDGATPVRAVPSTAAVGLVLVFAVAGALLGTGVRRALGLVAGIGVLVAVDLGAALDAARASIWWPSVPIALAGALATGAAALVSAQRERSERTFIQQLFGRYVSHDVAEYLRQRRGEFLEGGRPRPQRLVETVLIVDIAGSSRAAEQMASEDFVEWIDAALGPMAAIADRNGGIVEYYSGDGLKADFGVPIPRLTEAEIVGDARCAVAAAREIADWIETQNARFAEREWPRMRVRIGVHTGETVAGSVGQQRLQYTTLGDTANVASRIESYEKDGWHDEPGTPACRILVSEATRSRLGPDVATKAIGSVALRGKEQPIEVHHVLPTPFAETAP